MVSYTSLYSAFLLGSSTFVGSRTAVVVSEALASSLVLWLPSVVTAGVSTGVLGAGSVVGSMSMVGDPSLMTTALMGSGCSGNTVGLVGSWLGSSLIAGFGGCVYSGVSGVVVGSDVSSVVSASSESLRVILNAQWSRVCVSAGGLGLMGDDRFLAGFAVGASALTMTAVGSGVCSGVGGMASGTAASTGSLVVGS